LLNLIQSPVKAVRIIQRKRYIRSDGQAIHADSGCQLPIAQELDPAFAPAMSDSNDKKTYEMTQQEFFSMEKYCEPPSDDNSTYRNMMRVRVYDNFVSPDKNNPQAWHFAINDTTEKLLSPTPNFTSPYYKILRVSTILKPGVPINRALLAGISPDSKLLDICVRAVGLKNPKEQEIEARIRQMEAEISDLEKEANPRFSLFQSPGKKQ